MNKYLIITKERDFISKSRDALKHLKNSIGCGCMVYDKDGWFISYAKKDDNGVPRRAPAICDGEPHLYYAKIIKEYPIGIEWEDVDNIVSQYI